MGDREAMTEGAEEAIVVMGKQKRKGGDKGEEWEGVVEGRRRVSGAVRRDQHNQGEQRPQVVATPNLLLTLTNINLYALFIIDLYI